MTRVQLPAATRAAVDQLAVALTPQLTGPGQTRPRRCQVAAVLADLQEVAAALQIAGADSETGESAWGRRIRGILLGLLQAMRVLAPFAAAEDGPGNEVPRMRHLRAASLLPFPPPGALALDCLLEVFLRRRSPSDSRADLSRADTLRSAADDLRAAAAVLHRLDPRPAGRVIAQLAALAADLHRIAASGPGA